MAADSASGATSTTPLIIGTHPEQSACCTRRRCLRLTLFVTFILSGLTTLAAYENLGRVDNHFHLYGSKYSQIASPIVCGLSLITFLLTFSKCHREPLRYATSDTSLKPTTGFDYRYTGIEGLEDPPNLVPPKESDSDPNTLERSPSDPPPMKVKTPSFNTVHGISRDEDGNITSGSGLLPKSGSIATMVRLPSFSTAHPNPSKRAESTSGSDTLPSSPSTIRLMKLPSFHGDAVHKDDDNDTNETIDNLD